jgi:hypothetical protein
LKTPVPSPEALELPEDELDGFAPLGAAELGLAAVLLLAGAVVFVGPKPA